MTGTASNYAKVLPGDVGGGGSKTYLVFPSLLGGTNKFTNFLEVEIPAVFSRYLFLDKQLYLQNHPPKEKRETKEERAARFQRLMNENGWNRAELAPQLGVSRAWVTKVLG